MASINDGDRSFRPSTGGGSVKRFVLGFFLVVLILSAAYFGGNIVETNTAGFMQVKQAAVTGTLTCRMEAGMYYQGFGDIHTYSEAETFFFTADVETGEAANQSLATRFKDGAKADVSGSLRVILPTTCDDLKNLHRKFQSMDGVMTKLVLPAVRKALFNTGPHMSAGESYAERRGEFASLASDQLQFGVILVDKHEETRPDPITGEPKQVWIITKRECSPGVEDGTCINGYIRDRSAFAEFNVTITNFVVDGIEYPQAVLAQIEAQRKARMNIITQQAEAKEAEARAAKANAEAEAKIAETRALEEVQKTKLVVAAEGKREQARLGQEAAEFIKQEQILLGQGEAERKRLVLQADGALAQKLEALKTIQQYWADAYAKRQVPTMVMGGTPGQTDTASTDFSQMMQLLVASQLGVDLTIPKGTTRSE